jgi:hypothetical protein
VKPIPWDAWQEAKKSLWKIDKKYKTTGIYDSKYAGIHGFQLRCSIEDSVVLLALNKVGFWMNHHICSYKKVVWPKAFLEVCNIYHCSKYYAIEGR